MRFIGFILLFAFAANAEQSAIRVATFNVSMEATNYPGIEPQQDAIVPLLASGNVQQIKNIAEIIQRVAPDIILLNEFDYVADPKKGVEAFIDNYLAVSQSGQQPIDYPYYYVTTVNTGEPTDFDLDNNGKFSRYGADAYGFGLYEGQYGMVVLSKYPIETAKVRTMQTFLWKDMPGAEITLNPESQTPWYSDDEWNQLRLSSKSHWDVPIKVAGQTVHLLAMHPTPPVFDGEEDRNGKRNKDEIRLFADYLSPSTSAYIYDDKGRKGGLSKDSRFVLVGDFNAADIGSRHRDNVIEQLTQHPLVNNAIPTSPGGAQSHDAEYSDRFTAYWGARADYVLPSQYGFSVKDTGVFWPAKSDELFRLVKDRNASSDHRLVWVDLSIN